MSACKIPYLPLFVDRWETDENVKLMGPVTRCYYLTLLFYQWREGSIPADRNALKAILLFPSDPVLRIPSPPNNRDADEDLIDREACLDQVLKLFRSNGRSGIYRRLFNRTLATLRNAALDKHSVLVASGKQGRIKQLAGDAQDDTSATHRATPGPPPGIFKFKSKFKSNKSGEGPPLGQHPEEVEYLAAINGVFEEKYGHEPHWLEDIPYLLELVGRYPSLTIETVRGHYANFLASKDGFDIEQRGSLKYFCKKFDRFQVVPNGNHQKTRAQRNAEAIDAALGTG